jgi:hypothetical protein
MSIDILDNKTTTSLRENQLPFIEQLILVLLVLGAMSDSITAWFLNEYVMFALLGWVLAGASWLAVSELRAKMEGLDATNKIVLTKKDKRHYSVILIGWGNILYRGIQIGGLASLANYPLWQIALPILCLLQVCFLVGYKYYSHKIIQKYNSKIRDKER